MQTGPVRPKPGADIEVGKHAKDIKDTPKDNVQLNLSNKLAKRLEDEEKKKKAHQTLRHLAAICHASHLPSVFTPDARLKPESRQGDEAFKNERSAEDRLLSALTSFR